MTKKITEQEIQGISADELRVLRVLARDRVLAREDATSYLTRSMLRQHPSLSDLASKYIDGCLGRLVRKNLVYMQRLTIQGKPWGYQITAAGRGAASLDEPQKAQPPAQVDWLPDAILKTLLSRPEVGLWRIGELGGRLVVSCAGRTVTVEDVLAACNNLRERGLVALWIEGEAPGEVSLAIPRGIGLDGRWLRGQGAVTTNNAPPDPPDCVPNETYLPSRVAQVRLDYEAARELARVELEARHKVEQELANMKHAWEADRANLIAQGMTEKAAHDAGVMQLNDEEQAKALALTERFARGLAQTCLLMDVATVLMIIAACGTAVLVVLTLLKGM